MRVCAVSLPELRIELVRASMPADEQERPLAVVVAEPQLTERELLGNTRLSVVSREARALGVTKGQTIAQARARAADLAVRVVHPEAVNDVLARIAEVGLAFGATVSYATAPDLVWIDVTGCAHLHARRDARRDGTNDARHDALLDGEQILASRLTGAITSLGHVCFVAVADGPRVAAMLASTIAESAANAWTRAKRSPRTRGSLPIFEPLVVPPGGNAEALGPLPIAALPVGPDDVRWFAKLGVRSIEDLRTLPKDGLALRLGARAREVMCLAGGDDRAPLTAYVPPEIPEEEATLEYGIEGTQALTFVAKTLTDRLASRLAGRAVAAARIELDLRLDASMLAVAEPFMQAGGAGAETASASARAVASGRAGRRDGEAARAGEGGRAGARAGEGGRAGARDVVVPAPLGVAPLGREGWARAANDSDARLVTVSLDLPAPLSSAADLLAALRPKLERLVLAAPVLGAKLRAPVLVQQRAAALSLFEPQPRAERALPRLVGELVSDLGPQAVSILTVGDSWALENRSRLVPFGSAEAKAAAGLSLAKSPKKRRKMLASVPEPTRLLAEPRPVAREDVRIVRHLSRLEAVEWWKLPPASSPDAVPARKPLDHVQAWTDDGAAFVEIDRNTGAMKVRGWFD